MNTIRKSQFPVRRKLSQKYISRILYFFQPFQKSFNGNRTVSTSGVWEFISSDKWNWAFSHKLYHKRISGFSLNTWKVSGSINIDLGCSTSSDNISTFLYENTVVLTLPAKWFPWILQQKLPNIINKLLVRPCLCFPQEVGRFFRLQSERWYLIRIIPNWKQNEKSSLYVSHEVTRW